MFLHHNGIVDVKTQGGPARTPPLFPSGINRVNLSHKNALDFYLPFQIFRPSYGPDNFCVC